MRCQGPPNTTRSTVFRVYLVLCSQEATPSPAPSSEAGPSSDSAWSSPDLVGPGARRGNGGGSGVNGDLSFKRLSAWNL